MHMGRARQLWYNVWIDSPCFVIGQQTIFENEWFWKPGFCTNCLNYKLQLLFLEAFVRAAHSWRVVDCRWTRGWQIWGVLHRMSPPPTVFLQFPIDMNCIDPLPSFRSVSRQGFCLIYCAPWFLHKCGFSGLSTETVQMKEPLHFCIPFT